MPKGKPKAATQPAPQTTEKPKAKAEAVNGKPKNKMEGVRLALGKLGHEAKPPQIQGWLKDTYKLTMPVSTISNYKSTILSSSHSRQ